MYNVRTLSLTAVPLLVAYFLIVIIQLAGQYGVPGPFIFADETEYMRMIREFASGSFAVSQYNPLYPFLLSLGYHALPVTEFYSFVKAFNVAIYTASIFFIYPLALRLFSSKWSAVATACLVVMLPVSSSTFLTWANPLSYTLFFATTYFIVRLVESPQAMGIAALAGMTAGLAFLSKQGGAIDVVAVSIIAIWLFFKKEGDALSLFAVLIPGALAVAFMIIVRIIFDEGVTGYQHDASNGLSLPKLAPYVLKVLLTNIGVIYAAGFITLVAGFTLLLVNFKRLLPGQAAITVFAVLTGAGYLAIIIVHRVISPNVEFTSELPMGRYLAGPIALMFMLGFSVLTGRLRELVRGGSIIYWLSAGFGFFVVFGTELLSRYSAYDMLNTPQLALFAYFVTDGGVRWEPVKIVWDWRQWTIVGLMVAVTALGAIRLIWARYIVAMLVGIFTLGQFLAAQDYMLKISGSTKQINHAMRALSSDQAATVYFAPDIPGQHPEFVHNYWFGKLPVRAYGYDFMGVRFATTGESSFTVNGEVLPGISIESKAPVLATRDGLIGSAPARINIHVNCEGEYGFSVDGEATVQLDKSTTVSPKNLSFIISSTSSGWWGLKSLQFDMPNGCDVPTTYVTNSDTFNPFDPFGEPDLTNGQWRIYLLDNKRKF